MKKKKNPNLKFINNKVLQLLEDNNSLSIALEKRKITNWKVNDEYITILLNEIKESNLYDTYMSKTDTTFEEDKDLVVAIFTDLIAPNVKLYEYLEDHKLTWIDDVPLVNTLINKQLKSIQNTENGNFVVPKLYNDE